MKNKIYTILTNGWGERFLGEIAPFLGNDISVTRLRKDLGIDYSDYTSYERMLSQREKYDAVHYNSWFDIFCLWRKNKKNYTIFESHALHPGLDNFYARKIIESPWMKSFVSVFGWVFRLIFQRNIRHADLYLVSTPGFLESAKKVRKDVIWLPNPVYIPEKIERINTLGLQKDEINIFYPTGLRGIKNPEAAMLLLLELKNTYSNIRIFLFSHQHIPEYLKTSIKNLGSTLVWLEKASGEKMKEYYSHDWDLVIGNLYGEKPYAILNMIELEAMAHRLPIIAIDHYEILKYPLSDISIIAKKLITDKGYKQEYVERNLAYIYESHSPQSVAQIYSSNLKKSSLFSQVGTDNTR